MHTPWVGIVSTSLTVRTSMAKDMLHAKMTNTMLSDGELMIENETNRPMVTSLKGVRLNMVRFPQDKLYLLQYGVTIALQSRETCVIQVMSEKHINIKQLSL